MQRLRLADPYLLSAEIGGDCNYAGQGAQTGQWIPASGGWGVECRPKPKRRIGGKTGGSLYPLRDTTDLYLTVPTETGDTIKVRADAFDHLPEGAYNAIMDIVEPYNAPQMNGLFSKWRERQKEKKDERNTRKIDKISARAEGRGYVASQGGGIGGILKGVAGAIFGGKDDTGTQPADRAFSLDIAGGTPPPKKEWYKRPEIMIPAAIGAAGLIYLITRKKGKKK
jgi:hypothetical protein